MAYFITAKQIEEAQLSPKQVGQILNENRNVLRGYIDKHFKKWRIVEKFDRVLIWVNEIDFSSEAEIKVKLPYDLFPIFYRMSWWERLTWKNKQWIMNQ